MAGVLPIKIMIFGAGFPAFSDFVRGHFYQRFCAGAITKVLRQRPIL
jgi:hypothetical protein